MIDEKDKRIILVGEWYKYLALEVEMMSEDSFRVIMESLKRMGISSNKDKKLYQSCHVFTKKGKYYITHFKELFALDGRAVDITKEDIGRRNTIACLLEEWGLLKIVDRKRVELERVPVSSFKILTKDESYDYQLIPKYQIGVKK